MFELEGSSGSARTTYCCIPLDALGDFLDQLDAGILDRDIHAFLAAAPQGRVLTSVEQADEPGLYDELGPPRGRCLPNVILPTVGPSESTAAARARARPPR